MFDCKFSSVADFWACEKMGRLKKWRSAAIRAKYDNAFFGISGPWFLLATSPKNRVRTFVCISGRSHENVKYSLQININ